MRRLQPAMIVLLASVALVPLPFGSNRDWAWSLFALLIAVALILWLSAVVRGRAEVALQVSRVGLVGFPFGVALAWGFFQITLPETGFADHPIWAMAAQSLPVPVSGEMNLNGPAGWTALMRLLSYAGVFFLAVQLCRASEQAERAYVFLISVYLVYAFYGLIQFFSDPGKLLGFEKWAYRDDLTSTFVNANAFATYLGIGLVLAVGMLLRELRPVLSEFYRAREALIALFESAGVRMLLIVLSVPILTTALMLTHSRAGVASTALGVVAVIVASLFSRTLIRARLLIIAGFVAVIGGIMVSWSAAGIRDRMSSLELSVTNRANLYEALGQAILDRPFAGHGIGSYLESFWIYRSGDVTGYWDRAHNTYLENAVELGLPATISLTLSFCVIAGVCLFGIIKRRRHEFFPIIGIGATVVVAAHSVLDFGIQIPAVAATYAFIAGVAYAQAWPTRSLSDN